MVGLNPTFRSANNALFRPRRRRLDLLTASVGAALIAFGLLAPAGAHAATPLPILVAGMTLLAVRARQRARHRSPIRLYDGGGRVPNTRG